MVVHEGGSFTGNFPNGIGVNGAHGKNQGSMIPVTLRSVVVMVVTIVVVMPVVAVVVVTMSVVPVALGATSVGFLTLARYWVEH